MREKPLKGIKVLDLTRLLPGPVCTLHLADLGAEVIKIEDTKLGDYARSLGMKNNKIAPIFNAINRNKKSICLDLKQKDGKEIFEKLVKNCQVIIESFRPGVMKRLGFCYEKCSKINPAIIYCSISGYGQNGPYKNNAGHDINYLGLSGLLSQIGTKHGEPAIPNIQIGDILGGAIMPAMAILAGLIDSKRSEKGRYIDISMTDVLLTHNYQALSSFILKGFTYERGNDFLSGREPCYGVYKTLDNKYLAVGALEKKFWEKLCDLIEYPKLKSHHWENDDRDTKWAKDVLKKVFIKKSQKHWLDLLENEDCCVSPILDFESLINHPQIKKRKVFEDFDKGDDNLQFALPFKLNDFELENGKVPGQGEHTNEILRDIGYDTEQIESFIKKDTI